MTETQHGICSLLEKRGCLFLLPVKLHGGSQEQRPCWVTEESEETEATCQPFSACPWRKKLLICKCGCAEQKGRASTPHEEQQATDSGKLNKHQILFLSCCLSLLLTIGINLEKKKKKLICGSVDLYAKQLIAEYSPNNDSIWVIRTRKVLAALIRKCYKARWITTMISCFINKSFYPQFNPLMSSILILSHSSSATVDTTCSIPAPPLCCA